MKHLSGMRLLARLVPRTMNLGLLCAVVVLVPALAAAELSAQAYEQQSIEDVRLRARVGLDALGGLFDAERVRTLNNAEVAGERLGPLVAQGTGGDDLLKATADVRANALRSTSLLAVIDGGGRTLASDPASNLPFGTQGDVRTALQGRMTVGWQERGILALEATSPLRNGGPLAGAAVVATNVDDGFLNNGLRLTGLEMAIVTNGRIVAASRGLRRSLSFSGDVTADQALLGKPGDTFARSHVGPDGVFLAARSIMSGNREIGTMLVGAPLQPTDDSVRQVRLLAFAAALLGALGAGLIGARLDRRVNRRIAAAAELEQRLQAETHRAQHLQAVLGSLSEGVIVADADRRVMLVNPAARGLLSLPARGEEEKALGLFTDELEPANERVIRSYSAPVRDDAGQVLGTVTVLRDATRDQELDRLKSEFLTVVSHELQTPLTAIKGALELVLEDDAGQLSRVQRRFLETIERNSTRLIGLVGDLLDLSRLEAGRVELEPQPLDTPSLVRGALSAVSNLFDARGTHVQLDVPETVPPILGDRRRVEQILINLLANAVKYAPGGGVVEVAASSVDGHVTLSVADNGPGVPESEREMVFDKFYRGREAQRAEPGSGLGLAIVKSLVDLHGGTVRVEESAPRGARFVVELPRASEDDS